MAFLNGSLSDEQISGTHTSSGGESDSYTTNINYGFGSNVEMFTPGTNDSGEVDKHRVETSNEYNTPLKVDGALGTDHEEMHVDNVGRSTSTNNDHVLVAEDHAKYDEMGGGGDIFS